MIDGGDYGIIDNNIQAQGAPFPTSTSSGAVTAAVTIVPEPTAAIVMLLATLATLAGRRRAAAVMTGAWEMRNFVTALRSDDQSTPCGGHCSDARWYALVTSNISSPDHW